MATYLETWFYYLNGVESDPVNLGVITWDGATPKSTGASIYVQDIGPNTTDEVSTECDEFHIGTATYGSTQIFTDDFGTGTIYDFAPPWTTYTPGDYDPTSGGFTPGTATAHAVLTKDTGRAVWFAPSSAPAGTDVLGNPGLSLTDSSTDLDVYWLWKVKVTSTGGETYRRFRVSLGPGTGQLIHMNPDHIRVNFSSVLVEDVTVALNNGSWHEIGARRLLTPTASVASYKAINATFGLDQ